MIIVLDGTICLLRPLKQNARGLIVGPDATFLGRVFGDEDTRGDDGSAST